MGVSLSYTCSTRMATQDRARLRAAIAHAASAHSWWAESIRVWEQDETVAGNTKIFLPGYSMGDGDFREVDPEDDVIMAWRDTVQILKLLQECARNYRLIWDIDLAGGPFGQIKGDRDDQALFARADEILERATGFSPSDPSLPRRIIAIDAKYRDRDRIK